MMTSWQKYLFTSLPFVARTGLKHQDVPKALSLTGLQKAGQSEVREVEQGILERQLLKVSVSDKRQKKRHQ